MGYFKDLAADYAEKYCVIKSLNPCDPDEWEAAMEWATSHSREYMDQFIKDEW